MQQLPERLMSVTIPAENVPRVSHEEQQLPPDTPSSPSRGVVRSLEADGKTRRRSKDNLFLACEMEEMDDKTLARPRRRRARPEPAGGRAHRKAGARRRRDRRLLLVPRPRFKPVRHARQD